MPTVINPVAPTPAVDAVTSLQVTGNTNLTSVGETSQLTATAGFVSRREPRRDLGDDLALLQPGGRDHFSQGTADRGDARAGVNQRKLSDEGQQRNLSDEGHQSRSGVLRSGTFIVRGRVNEPANLDIWNARFEVVDGPQAGRFTMTNSFGLYELYGLSGDIRVTVTKEGYIAQTKSVAMTQDRVLNFEILPAVAPTAIAGNYRLTFTASQRCASQLVEEARTRIYSARINQDQARVDVLLSDANFALEPTREAVTPSKAGLRQTQ